MTTFSNTTLKSPYNVELIWYHQYIWKMHSTVCWKISQHVLCTVKNHINITVPCRSVCLSLGNVALLTPAVIINLTSTREGGTERKRLDREGVYVGGEIWGGGYDGFCFSLPKKHFDFMISVECYTKRRSNNVAHFFPNWDFSQNSLGGGNAAPHIAC